MAEPIPPGEPVMLNCQECDHALFVIIRSELARRDYYQCAKCGKVQDA